MEELLKQDNRIEIEEDKDLAHTENPTRRTKPPARSFTELKFEDKGPGKDTVTGTAASGVQVYNLCAPRTEKNTKKPLYMSCSGHAEGVYRIRVGEGEVPSSWSVVELPPAFEVFSPSLEERNSSPEFVLGPLKIGKWRYNPGALRFTLESVSHIPRVYGLGEKMGRLDRSGRVWEMWNTDEPEHVPSRDPLYVSIPFAFVGIENRWFGIFVDNPARQYWDVATSNQKELTIDVEDDYLDIYLMEGASPREVLRRYTGLTGVTPLPPIWGLGYHQSRYSYSPDAEVRRVAGEFRKNELPADVIQFDIDYMNGYRIFTWDKEGFPDPPSLIDDLSDSGFKVVTIVDPGVKVDPEYSVYREGLSRGYFCTLPDGTIYQGAVWPGKAVYPDFSRQAVRTWWGDLHRELFKHGVSGIWNDMNEPADFTGDSEYRPDYTVPNELRAATDTGTAVSFARFHNLYSGGMNRATREGFSKHKPETRGFLITRSGYAGVQRNAGVWTGDNCSWWEHLDSAVPMLLSLSISGVSLVGSDTGGFQEDASAQLYARWFCFSAFTPYFRSHSADDTRPHEPWSFGGNVLNITRHYLRLRYSLMPYIYTAFFRTESEGEPVMKPLFFEWPGDERLAEVNNEYMFGPSLLAAPVTTADTLWQHVYLPEGLWYDFWEDILYRGQSDRLVSAPIGKLPLFVRGGSILPHEAPRLHTGVERSGGLFLDVYPDENDRAAGELYCDAEEGWGYRNGEYSLIAFIYQKGKVQVRYENEGFQPPWSTLNVRVHTGGEGCSGQTAHTTSKGGGPVVSETTSSRTRLSEKTADPLRLTSVKLPRPFACEQSEKGRLEIPLTGGEYSIAVDIDARENL